MNILRNIVGLLLLPWAWALSRTVLSLLAGLPEPSNGLLSSAAVALGGGYLLWLLIFYTLPRPARAYVLGHELTHALWGVLLGSKVSRIKVGSDSGFVELSKTNFIITLAPYFFPFYTMILIVLYGCLGLFCDVRPYQFAWLAAVGFTWGFHFTFTLVTLFQHQTDIQSVGHLFAWSIIYCFNVLGIAVWIVVVSPASWGQLVDALLLHTRDAYGACLTAALQAWSAWRTK